MEIMLDTNILGRFADRADPQYKVTESAIHLLQKQGDILTFTPQIKREFLDFAERPKGTGPGKNGLGLTSTQARALIEQFKTTITYRLDIPEVDIHFDILHKRFGGGRTVHDLNIVASMLAHGINTILTYNERDFAVVRDTGIITLVTPNQVLQGQNT